MDSSVSSVFSVSHCYLADSDLLATATYPSDIHVTRSCGTNRNLLTAIENKVGTTTVSRYEYTRVRRKLEVPTPAAGRGRSGPRSLFDAIGRRTAVHPATERMLSGRTLGVRLMGAGYSNERR